MQTAFREPGNHIMKSSRYRNLALLASFSALIMFATGCDKTPATQTAEPAAKPDAAQVPPLAVSPSAPISTAPTPVKSPSTVLVKVDDKVITQGDVDKEMAKRVSMEKKRGASDERLAMLAPYLKPQAIEGLINRQLLENECEKKKITVTEDETKAETEKVKADLPEGLSLDDMLAQTGLSQAMFEIDLKEHIKLQKLLKVSDPTPEEVRAYYDDNVKFFDIPEMVHARHILIKTDEEDSAEARAAKKEKAEKLRKQLVEGTDFGKLAAEHSECPSKAMGGDLGRVLRGRMVPPFEKAAFVLSTNEISPIVETEDGFHIIQMLEHDEPRTMKFDEVKTRIAAVIKAKELQQKAGSLIQILREKAKITYMSGVRPPMPRIRPPMPRAM